MINKLSSSLRFSQDVSVPLLSYFLQFSPKAVFNGREVKTIAMSVCSPSQRDKNSVILNTGQTVVCKGLLTGG